MIENLNDIRVFVGVVDAGSFTKAGKMLAVPTSTASRRVARLERSLGARLLHRTTRKLSLTDAGRLYYERSVRALAELEEAENILSEARTTPRGRVRVCVPLEHRTSMTLVNEFLKSYPEVRIEIDFSSRDVNILEEGFDASLRAGLPTNNSVIAYKLMDSPFSIVASPGYLRRYGEPRRVSDLSEHDCIIFGASSSNAQWVLGGSAEPVTVFVRGKIASNHLFAVRDAALAGHGLALLPTLVCNAAIFAGELCTVLPDASPPAIPLYISYRADRHLPAAVRAFVDFVKANFRRVFEAVP